MHPDMLGNAAFEWRDRRLDQADQHRRRRELRATAPRPIGHRLARWFRLGRTQRRQPRLAGLAATPDVATATATGRL